MTRVDLAPFTHSHVPAAAALATERYCVLRRSLPVLPAEHEDPGGFQGKLAPIAAAGSGFAAFTGNRFAGFLAGIRIPSFMGSGPGWYVPEWAHGVRGEDRGAILGRLYQAIAAAWVADGCINHAITLLAGEAVERDTFFQLGFGMCTVDAVRGIDSVAGPLESDDPDAIVIRKAMPEDAAALAELSAALRRHTASSPVFLHHPERDGEHERREWLSLPGCEAWLAFELGCPVGFMQREPVNYGAAFVVSAPDTLAVTGAFVEEASRGRGVARALLARIVDSARAKGARRVSVDFESANAEGWSFWLRHFRPACWSVLRRVDDRLPVPRRALHETEPR